jgi:hypothetical protein
MRRTLGWLLVWLMPVSLHAETGYDTWPLGNIARLYPTS